MRSQSILRARPFRFVRALVIVAGAILVGTANAAEPKTHEAVPRAIEASDEAPLTPRLHRVPLAFIENHGQFADPVLYAIDGRGYTSYFTSTEIVTVPRHARELVLRQSFADASSAVCLEGLEPSGGQVHSIRGNDPAQWVTHVPVFGKIAYRELYPGIDAVWYGTADNCLEYDFVVAPGADPRCIRMRFDGAQSITIEENGDLVLDMDGVSLRKQKPLVYQGSHTERTLVEARYELLDDRTVGFDVGTYDPTRTLIIDPIVLTATYLGGTLFDNADAVALDDAGNIYILGETDSTDFPTVNPLQPANSGSVDIFVSKFDPTGTVQLWSTYLGGSGADTARDFSLDDAGRIWLLGNTASTDFPVQGPIQGTLAGDQDIVLAVLDSSGSSLLFSTYYGGSYFESAGSLAYDPAGAVYVSGDTESADFPVVSALQSQLAGDADGFILKVDPAGGPSVAYSTYLGGSDGDDAKALAVHGGRLYVTGRTTSNDFPTVSPFQSSNAGFTDAFVSVLNSAGSALLYSTYFGGSDFDDADKMAIDPSGNIWITGETRSADLPTARAIQPSNAGEQDIFLAGLDPTGATLVASTYLGGIDDDAIDGIAIDHEGAIYLSGFASELFPTRNAWQGFGGDVDAVLVKLSPFASAIEFSSYIGGSNEEYGAEIAVRGAQIVVTGTTSSSDFPTVAPFQSNLGGDQDAFLMSLRDIRVHVSPSDSVLLDSQDFTLAFIVEGSTQAQWSRIAFNGIDKTQFVLNRATVGTLDGPTQGMTLRLPIRAQQIVNALGTGPVTVTAEAIDGSHTLTTSVTWRLLGETASR